MLFFFCRVWVINAACMTYWAGAFWEQHQAGSSSFIEWSRIKLSIAYLLSLTLMTAYLLLCYTFNPQSQIVGLQDTGICPWATMYKNKNTTRPGGDLSLHLRQRRKRHVSFEALDCCRSWWPYKSSFIWPLMQLNTNMDGICFKHCVPEALLRCEELAF